MVYDAQNRPFTIASESRAIIDLIFRDDTHNYHKAKAILQVGKAELIKKNQESCEQLFLESKAHITEVFGNSSPLLVKYNQSLIESYNLKPESDERTAQIVEMCQKNLELTATEYGENSLYCVRILYTLFTARLHEETGKGS